MFKKILKFVSINKLMIFFSLIGTISLAVVYHFFRYIQLSKNKIITDTETNIRKEENKKFDDYLEDIKEEQEKEIKEKEGEGYDKDFII